MKRTKKLFVGLALAGLLLTGCGSNNASKGGDFRQQDIYKLYKANGGSLSYQNLFFKEKEKKTSYEKN